MMRAEDETGDRNRLPPVSVLLNRGDVLFQDREVENVKAIKDKVGKKVLNLPALSDGRDGIREWGGGC